MASRLNLHNKLLEILGEPNVYYQAPSTLKRSYPAILYERSEVKTIAADNKPYRNSTGYEVIVVDTTPDNPAIDLLLAMPGCRFVTHYEADGLNHDVFNLFY